MDEPTEDLGTEEEAFVPQFEAPERRVNLQTLRNLANQSTQQAIESFTEKKRTKMKLINAGLFAGALVISLSLLSLSKQPGDLSFLAGITILAGSAIASVWLLAKHRAWDVFAQLRLPANNESQTDTETPDAEASAEPTNADE